MGIALTTLFLILSYLSPGEIVPGLAPYRVEMWFALPSAGFALVNMFRNIYNLRMPQIYLLGGLYFAVGFSRLASQHNIGASGSAVLEFLVSSIPFFFVLFNATSLRALRVLVTAIIFVAIYLAIQGIIAYPLTNHETPAILVHEAMNAQGQFETVKRIRGYGFLSDPNDLAQFLLVALAALGIDWRRGGLYRLMFVIIPGIILFAGIALTRSRGALLGIVALFAFALLDRMGRVKAAISSAFVGAVLMALNFTGNRAISESAGLDRIDSWREGLGMFRSSPLWGIGYGWYTKHYAITAHNSFVLCFSELGLIGYFFWIGLIVFSLGQLRTMIRFEAQNDTQRDIQYWARAIRLALYTFLVTSWFLSRTYTVTFYLLIGIITSLTALMRQEVPTLPLAPVRFLVRNTIMAVMATLVLVYMTLKFRNLSF